MKKDMQKSTQQTNPSIGQFKPKNTLDKAAQKQVKGGNGEEENPDSEAIHEDVIDL